MGATRSTLTHLPIQLRMGGHKMCLQRLTSEQIPEAYKLVFAEAARSQDIGLDEFTSQDHLASHITCADSFSFTDSHTGMLQAFLTLTASGYCRSTRPLLADGRIICEGTLKTKLLQPLMQVADTLTAHLGFEGLLIEAFTPTMLVSELQSAGFKVIGCIPKSGYLSQNGWMDSLILMKDIVTPTTQNSWIHLQHTTNYQMTSLVDIVVTPHDDDVITGGDDVTHQGELLSSVMYFTQRPRLQYLPRRYPLRSGENVILRYMREDEIDIVYNMFKDASERALGYSTDEFKSLEVFRFYVTDFGHPFVVEDPETSQLLVCFSVIPSTSCRTMNPRYADGYIVVNPESTMKGLGSEGVSLMARFACDLGYEGLMGDCLVNNPRMLRIMAKLGFVNVGYIPKAAQGADGTHTDMMLTFMDFANRSIAKL